MKIYETGYLWFLNLIKKHMLRSKLRKLKRAGLQVGKGTLLYPEFDSFGSEPFLIRIGENCIVAKGVKFITHDGAVRVINNKDGKGTIRNKFGKIDIGDNVYIGENSIIMMNVSIGSNAYILPGSVVYRDVPGSFAAGGNPAVLKNRIEDFHPSYANEIYSKYKSHYVKYCGG